jgi:hypothetical protein
MILVSVLMRSFIIDCELENDYYDQIPYNLNIARS